MSLVGFKSSNHPQQVGKRGATERDNLGTDPALFAKLDARFHFTLDVAASHENAKCERYLTKDDAPFDGLGATWTGQRVWCNPPYSDIRPWIEKAWAEADTAELIVMLLPANRTEQAWWQDCVEPLRRAAIGDFLVEFLRGRQRFVLPGSDSIGPNERPPFGCCLFDLEREMNNDERTPRVEAAARALFAASWQLRGTTIQWDEATSIDHQWYRETAGGVLAAADAAAGPQNERPQ